MVVCAERLRSGAALLGRQLSGDDLDGVFGEALAQMGAQVVGGGDVAAEHHRGVILPEQIFQDRHQPGELGVVALAFEPARLFQQRAERGILGARFDVVVSEGIGTAVEHARGEFLGAVLVGRQAPGGERLRRRGRARGDAAHQRQRAPEGEALAARVATGLFGDSGAVVEHGLEELLPATTEPVGGLGHLTAREQAVIFPGIDVRAAALHVVGGELLTQPVARLALGGGERLEGRLEQREQPVERLLVATVRGGGEQHQVALRVGGQLLEQRVTQMRAVAGRRAGVGLVDDHQLGAGAGEFVAPLLAFDVVQADHGDGMLLEQAHADRQAALQTRGAGGGDRHRREVEAFGQFPDPLLDQVRRAEHGKALDLAAVEQLAGDQQRLDGLADADVVGDQQAHRVELERHQQRHQLIAAGLDADVAEAAEWPGAAAQRQRQRIGQQRGGFAVADVVGRRGVEMCRPDVRFEFQVQPGGVGLGARQRAQVQGLGLAGRQHHPVTAAGADQAAGGVSRCVHGSTQQAALQSGLHVLPAIGDQHDGDGAGRYLIDHPPWLVVKLAELLDTEGGQLRRVLAALGEVAQRGELFVDPIQHVSGAFDAVLRGDEGVQVIEIAQRILGEKDGKAHSLPW